MGLGTCCSTSTPRVRVRVRARVRVRVRVRVMVRVRVRVGVRVRVRVRVKHLLQHQQPHAQAQLPAHRPQLGRGLGPSAAVGGGGYMSVTRRLHIGYITVTQLVGRGAFDARREVQWRGRGA